MYSMNCTLMNGIIKSAHMVTNDSVESLSAMFITLNFIGCSCVIGVTLCFDDRNKQHDYPTISVSTYIPWPRFNLALNIIK